jgi:hypothetical protein
MPGELLINRGGIMAWAAQAPGSGDTTEIGVCSSAGRRIIAEGMSIDDDSVTLRGLTLSWKDSGIRRSVVLMR